MPAPRTPDHWVRDVCGSCTSPDGSGHLQTLRKDPAEALPWGLFVTLTVSDMVLLIGLLSYWRVRGLSLGLVNGRPLSSSSGATQQQHLPELGPHSSSSPELKKVNGGAPWQAVGLCVLSHWRTLC